MKSNILVITTELAVSKTLWQNVQQLMLRHLLDESMETQDGWAMLEDRAWQASETGNCLSYIAFTPGAVKVKVQHNGETQVPYTLPVVKMGKDYAAFKRALFDSGLLHGITEGLLEAAVYMIIKRVPTSPDLLEMFESIDNYQYTIEFVAPQV